MSIAGRGGRFTAGGRALRHRNYRLYFFGQLISQTGTWMQTVGQGWLVGTLVGWDQAVVYIGLLGVVQFLPVLTLSLFGGIIADVWPKRWNLVGTQTAAGILALVLGTLTLLHFVAVWQIFVLGFCLGIVNAVDTPTRQSFVMEMVGPEDVVNAVALNSAVFNGSRIVGPAVAGLVIGIIGIAPCFILNGLSYGAVILGLLLMRDEDLMPATRLAMPRSVGAVGSNLAEGLRYVRHTPVVLLVIYLAFFVSTFGMNFNVVLPVMSASVFHVGASGYGFLSASMGAGALVSALAVATFTGPRYRILIGGGAMLGLCELVLASTSSYPVAVVAVFLCGVAALFASASANSIMQLAVPGPLRGRVMSVLTMVTMGSSPIGNGFTGTVGGIAGTPFAILVNGSIVFLSEAAAAFAVLRGWIRGELVPRRDLVGPTEEGGLPADR